MAAEARGEGGGAEGADGALARRHLSAHQRKLLKKVPLGGFAFAMCSVRVMTCDNHSVAWKRLVRSYAKTTQASPLLGRVVHKRHPLKTH